ncbi:MAG: hypothetical protein IJ651_07050 [Bacteroidales bacterium]|nr:hypothetical protein [Bacteroidales bacterium]
MKKFFVMLAAAAALLAAPGVQAQDSQLFNHMAIGVNMDLLNGAGLDIAMPIGPMFQVRAGFNTHDPLFNMVSLDGNKLSNFNTTIPVSYKDGGIDVDRINLNGSLKYSHAELLFDFFPTKTTSFHFTAGAWFAFSPLLHADGKAMNSSGSNAVPQSDWARTTLFDVSTNNEGSIVADVKFGLNTVKPYIGLGFGRPVSLEHRVGFNFNLGLLVTGGLHLYTYDFTSSDPKPVELNSEWANKYGFQNMNDKAGTYLEYIDILNKFPVWPAMRFSLFVRLF